MKESISAFKEKILTFVKRNIVIKVFAGILAIILWLVINNQLNPVVTDIANMPRIIVNYTIKPGEIVVESSSGITLKNINSGNIQNGNTPNVLSVDFYASGRKNQIDTLTYNDFTIDLDLSEVKRSGESREYEVKIIVKSSVWGVEPKNQTIESVKLTFEEVKEKVNIPLEIAYKDSEIAAEDYTVVSSNLSIKTLDITGFESIVSNIAKARIDLTADDFQQKLTSDTTIKKTYTFYDADNRKVEIEGYNPDPIEVFLQIGKRVKLNYTIKGSPRTEVYLKESEITPTHVIVVGSSSILDGLKELNTSEVSIDDRDSDFSKQVEILSLPPGISLVEEVEPTVSVKFGGIISRVMTIGINKVTITGRNVEKYDYSIELVSDLTVKGNDDMIKNLSVDSLKPSISVSGYGPGVFDIPVIVSLPSDISVTSNAMAKVRIIEKIIVTPTPGPTDNPPSNNPSDATGTPPASPDPAAP